MPILASVRVDAGRRPGDPFGYRRAVHSRRCAWVVVVLRCLGRGAPSAIGYLPRPTLRAKALPGILYDV